MWSHEDTNNILINKNAVLFIFEITSVHLKMDEFKN
jgi:hypothetical protein